MGRAMVMIFLLLPALGWALEGVRVDRKQVAAATARIDAAHAALRACGLDAALANTLTQKGAKMSTKETLKATVTPAGMGTQLVRLSLPLPPGFLGDGQALAAFDGTRTQRASVRPLSRYAKTGAARRALVTFPYEFKDFNPVTFTFTPAPAKNPAPKLPVKVTVDGDRLVIAYKHGPRLEARLIAPPGKASGPVKVQTVESNANYRWQLFRTEDAEWSRIIDVRIDALGTVAVTALLQRSTVTTSPYDGTKRAYDIAFTTAPDFGWEIQTTSQECGLEENTVITKVEGEAEHPFTGGQGCAFLFDDWGYQLYHPVAPFTYRGSVRVQREGDRMDYRYLRCAAAEKVPMQSTAWRRAEFVVSPVGQAQLTSTLEYPHLMTTDPKLWDALYGTGEPLDLAGQPELAKLTAYHHDTIYASMAFGDDFGNVTSFDASQPHRAVHTMLRLNHCPAIFFEGWRSGDRRLVNTGVLWCRNFRDMGIWWGPENYGGTRYPYTTGPADFGKDFCWRSDEGGASFCTKGFDAFFLAYEQTGDPLLLEALGAQTQYAKRFVHALPGTTRNIGVAIDFVRLYRYTGQERYLDEALRLFRELRDSGALLENNLFTEGGGPATNDENYMASDGVGYDGTYLKPYILGYGLEGLPALLALCPEEPRLREAVEAMADFQAASQDPLGAWRYPHPRSPYQIVNQALEHAMQIVNGDLALGPREAHLDAIERMLRLRLHFWLKTGAIMNGLGGWEAGPDGKTAVDTMKQYELAAERDTTRDYTEGAISSGGSAIEGLVYLPEVLRFYLQHRPADRLLAPPAPDSPLGKVLGRVK